MGLFSRRHRGSQVSTPEALYQVPVAFGSSLTFLCDCGRGMYLSAVVNGTETSKTIRMTCGGCKRILDVTLDAGYAIEAVTRTSAVPGSATARQVIAAVLAEIPDLTTERYVHMAVDNILLGFDANGMEIVASGEVEDAPEVLGRARPDRPTGW